ncbi:hypothetical protein DPMN_142068 [Dreissena polymorpha]|uniref:Uncharacterized protein n=1 Tax=Dreissena polymorpha TaxID=45954 RepID=A0A9D4JKH3_DREPO|nr:hypothetical protein DPMN_142068 [Dreissena polymorpha]
MEQLMGTQCDGHVITIEDQKEQEWVTRIASNFTDFPNFWLDITNANDIDNFKRKHDHAEVSYYTLMVTKSVLSPEPLIRGDGTM